jgi:hypothetical protein
MENIFQTAELAANSDNPDFRRDKGKKQEAIFFFFLQQRLQGLKLRSPVTFEHHITCPLNGWDMICP